MQRALIEQHLTLARSHVKLGEQHIASQRQIVLDLQVRGVDDALAMQTLDNFVAMQLMHVSDKGRLDRELSAADPDEPAA
jgi:hypothetical protein